MDWVKLSARYYLDVAIAGFDDATEVMFTRGLAYAGDQQTHGYLPAGILPALCRRRRYETCAEALVASGLWRPVRGGYQITRWQEWQSELEVLVARRSADRDRKRRERERASTAEEPQVKPMSRDESTDESAPIESKRQKQQKTSSSVPRAKRAQRLPDDFEVTPDMVTWARQNTPHVDGQLETDRFRDYWRAKAGREACKLDWPATWRNWMRRAADQQPPPSRGRHSRQAETDELFGRAMARAEAREDAHDPARNGNAHPIRQGALPPASH